MSNEFKIKSVSQYEAEGVIFSDPAEINKFEQNYSKKQQQKRLSCKKHVLTKKGRVRLSKEQIKNQQDNCESLHSDLWLSSEQWLRFKSKIQDGDVVYRIEERLKTRRVTGYVGYAIVRQGMVIDICYSVLF